MRVYQLGHGVIPGDAISTHIFEIDRRLRLWGFETAIFAQHVAPEYRHRASPDVQFAPFLGRKDDLLLYHYSIYTPNIRLFQAFRGRKVVIYHNITPARFFWRWDRRQAWLCSLGRRALRFLRHGDWGAGVSEYNRQELIQAGFPPDRTSVLPIFLPIEEFDHTPSNGQLLERLRADGMVNFLSVGRVAPNKTIEDTIRVFSIYHRYINPRSRLFVVGSRYIRAYDDQINALVRALGLQEAVILTGRVSLSDLKTYYQGATLYLTTSRHEGFCVPLIESMYFGVPILARHATAIPETLGESGIMFTRLGYVEVAEMAHLLATDEGLRAHVVRAQRRRLEAFAPERVEEKLRFVLEQVGAL